MSVPAETNPSRKSPNAPTLPSRGRLAVIGAACIAAVAPGSSGQSPPARDDSAIVREAGGEPAFHAELRTWIWLVGMDGDVGIGNVTADVSADFGDVLDASDSVFAFSGRLEIGRGPWGGFIDGMYARLGADDQGGSAGVSSVDVTNEMGLIDAGLSYRVGDWAPTGEAALNPRRITLDLYGGVRYTDLELELDAAALPAVDRSVDWFDPIVGGKLTLPLAERWHLEANGDIGGFGVGSDFTWSATAVVGHDFRAFGHPATVFAGYRAIGQDYSRGSGASRFRWDVVQHGPVLGFALRF